MTVIENAYAKINLTLDVVARRADGYHDLVSIMQNISLADTLRFEKTESLEVVLETHGVLPADDSNLILRAARAYFNTVSQDFGVRIDLQKRIPMQAGLGGGSADAAATLRALNVLNHNKLSVDELCEIGASLGADVPFCIVGGTQICRGIGERMQPIANRLQGSIVVAMAGEGVSTPKAFGAMDAQFGDFSAQAQQAEQRLPQIRRALECGAADEVAPLLYNRFEEVICPIRPAVVHIKDTMRASGAQTALMSGSGPSVFGIFAREEDARAATEALKDSGAMAHMCTLI